MIKMVISQLKTALIFLIIMHILTGIIYPVATTVIAQLFFKQEANGSLIEKNGELIGSVLIGQSFTNPKYFFGRPSATIPFPYNAESSSGSNFGPMNSNFISIIKERISYLNKFDKKNNSIPIDLLTASASGLDPEISPLAAFYQVPRIAKERNVTEKSIQDLIESLIEKRTFKILGEPRINVLKLNLALDNLDNSRKKNVN